MNNFNSFLIKKLFIISSEPVKFADLLEANALFLEKMPLESAKLHFKTRIFMSYFIYICICACVFLPLLLATHFFFEHLDIHFSILSAVAATSLFFIGFDIFRIYIQKLICAYLIKKNWQIHFPYFEFNKYKNIVNDLYKQAQSSDISKTKLEQFILENLVKAADYDGKL